MIFYVDDQKYVARPFRTVGDSWAVSMHPQSTAPDAPAGNAGNIEVDDAADERDACEKAVRIFKAAKART